MGIFTTDLFDENEKKKKKLIELIASKEAFLMVGAGSSRIQGYPMWGELLKYYEKYIADMAGPPFAARGPIETDILYASRIKQRLKAQYYTVLYDLYSVNNEFNLCHAALVTLPFKGIITTNYDRILERAVLSKFPNADPSELVVDKSINPREFYKFFRSLSSPAPHPQIVHLHGEIRNKDSIVLCAEEYEEKYGIRITNNNGTDPVEFTDNNWTLHRKLIWSLMATRRMVYLGFSMSDEYFKIMHLLVTEDVANYNSDIHYMVARITAKDNIAAKRTQASKLKMELGIETVFFEDDDESKGLENFIFEIEQEIKNFRQPPTAEPVKSPSIIGQNQAANDRLFSISRKQIKNDD